MDQVIGQFKLNRFKGATGCAPGQLGELATAKARRPFTVNDGRSMLMK